MNSLDALLASGGDITEDVGEMDDPDLKDDVLLQINLQVMARFLLGTNFDFFSRTWCCI